ncbi:MAG: DEAD/DEAH box helicase, partial [Methanomicrobiales archaeon]|nr:DEAD/DEAH box helicase [Methanomicrobiales archaeon]
WKSPFDSWILNFANFDLVVCDESHRIKAAGSSVSKYLAKVADRVPYKLCLTGTPMPHGPMDLYGQYRFLDKGIFGISFTKFRARYAQMVPLGMTGISKIIGYQNQDEMHDKFYSIAYRADRDVLELPDAIHNTREVELDPKTMKIYKNLEKDFYSWIAEDKEVTIRNALAKILRLQQVTSGHIPSDEGEILTVGTEKAEALAELFEDISADEPIVVFCRFRHDLDMIIQTAQKIGRTVCELSGRCNQLAEWQEGKYSVIAVQIQAGGVGVDLTRACYCVYYSVGHSLGDYEQSLARIHRPGQERTVFYYHLVASGTIDEKVYKSLHDKKDIVQAILDREV